MTTRLRRLVDEVSRLIEAHQGVTERRHLRNRPWLEDSLHWSRSGRLHGHVPSAPRSRVSSVTSDGWCPGLVTE